MVSLNSIKDGKNGKEKEEEKEEEKVIDSKI